MDSAIQLDLGDYVLGGYKILKPSNTGFWPSDLLPEKVVSLSGCICPFLDPSWSWLSHQDALDFGVSASKLDAFDRWSRTLKDSSTYGLFQNMHDAQYAMHELLDSKDAMLVGVGIHQSLATDFLTFRPVPGDFDERNSTAKSALEANVVKQCLPMPAGGSPLGFEVVAFYGEFSCSWLCSGTEHTMHQEFGIRPGQRGLLTNYADATRVYEWIAEDNMEGKRAEPLPYYPWLLVQY